MNAESSFDRIARSYQLLEYLTLGRWLERARLHFLPQLHLAHNALILGDGDGRFLARLLDSNRSLRATAVDSSEVMLDLLRARCKSHAERLRIVHDNALHYIPDNNDRYDLVVTHFFLDCLTSKQVNQLIQQIAPGLSPEAIWLVSDFQIPPGKLALPAKLVVRALYLVFRVLTGLRVTRLPDHAAALAHAGFCNIGREQFLGGLLFTEFWKATGPSNHS